MNTDHLRTLIALAEAGSFHKAAKLLYLTPPAVKHALDALESETGLTLFTRSHAGLEITESGTVFAEYATRTLKLLNEGLSLAADASLGERHAIDAPWVDAPFKDPLYPPAFSAFQTAHPEINVEFRKVNSLIGEHYDVISGFADVAHTHAVGHALSLLPLCCIVAKDHPLAAREHIAIEELSPYRLLVPHQEFVDLMDERTRAFLESKDDVEHMALGHQESEFFSWCVKERHAVLVIGKWPRGGEATYTEALPIEGASCTNHVYTQEHPSRAAMTYVEFMRAFYADADTDGSNA